MAGQLRHRPRSRWPDLKLLVAGATIAIVAASCSSAPAASGARTAPTTVSQGAQRLRLSPRRLTGVVRAVGPSYLTVRDKGLTVTLELSPTTRYRQAGQRTGKQALVDGERVRIFLAKASTPPKAQAATVVVLPTTIAGKGTCSRAGRAERASTHHRPRATC